jgi:hypothetical protein
MTTISTDPRTAVIAYATACREALNAGLPCPRYEGPYLTGAELDGVEGLPQLHGDPRALRLAVADHIEAYPHLHDQLEWGDGSADPHCGTPCCVAGWACHLGGGDHGYNVPTAAALLLHVYGLPMPDFSSYANRADIVAALRTTE